MKKLVCIVTAIITLLMLASCGPKEKLLDIQPRFVGEPVTDVNYQFTKDDFEVYGVYTNDVTVILEDYEFEVETMSGGYFHIRFTYKDASNYCYVECDVDIFS